MCTFKYYSGSSLIYYYSIGSIFANGTLLNFLLKSLEIIFKLFSKVPLSAEDIIVISTYFWHQRIDSSIFCIPLSSIKVALSIWTAGFKLEMKHYSANILDINLKKELFETNVKLKITILLNTP